MNFILFIIIPLILGLWAQTKVHGTYTKWSKILAKSRITGKETALALMQSAGITDVTVVSIPGHLTDHYDPSKKQLALSKENYSGTSLAALGVAAHEAGHAIQHKERYAPLQLRAALIPITNISCTILPLIIIGSLLFPFLGQKALMLAIGAYIILTIFQLVTLPVEFDASRRAKERLVTLGIIDTQELIGVNKTLDAAAFTYVAAFIASLGTLLHYIQIFNSNKE